ncbi:GAF domain-containing protein [Streptomyces sp. NPDC002812]|uniref:GAF domain-containing protein n=1 Tax=unclassified Streptomyces TaxID=2593676 RepID=UPI00224E8DCB|nr:MULTISPECIES: GAF domain-containing protein [unclassified Streptomyces]MCX5128027.1 GAF domain-containing protein [Streptomyces sp. NBC_00347]MCX5301306.1 GAF domain-containing protein [Streptomyces sp. NBC_00193]
MKPWPHDLMATERQLLQSVVTVARYIYGAAASSVFMVSPDTGELIFAAVAGEGEQGLVGRRFEPGTGIAGWVAASGQPLITDDVGATDRFARDAAASTGYVPASIMAAPLIADGECIGVIEVLDRHVHDANAPGRELDDIELLGLLATQAALSLALLRRSEQAADAAPRMGELLARLSQHAVMDASDPLAVSLLTLSLDLLDRGSHPGSKVV